MFIKVRDNYNECFYINGDCIEAFGKYGDVTYLKLRGRDGPLIIDHDLNTISEQLTNFYGLTDFVYGEEKKNENR